MLFIDVETRSTISIVTAGIHGLIMDPTLRLLCVSYAIGAGEVKTWRCAFADGDPDLAEPVPDDLAEALADEDMPILTWNEAMERLTLNALRHRYNIPALALRRFIDIMALARAHNMAGSLDKASKDWLPKSDRKLTSKAAKWMWSTTKPLLAKHRKEFEAGQVAYCEHDVHSMREIYKLMLEPTMDFLEQYWAAAAVNDRGVTMDLDLIDAAITLAPEVDREIRVDMDRLTGGEVKPRGPSLRAWLVEQLPEELEPLLYKQNKKRKGYGWTTTTRPSTDKNVRKVLLEALDDYEGMDDIREVLALYDEANRAAVTKYSAARKRTDPEEGILRGQYMFNGAAQTGRFAATGMQVHNLIRSVPKNALEMIDVIRTCSTDLIRARTGLTVNTALSQLVRTAFMASKGHKLVWGDWSSIEARMLPWLAKDHRAQRVLDAFETGADLYVQEAAGIYGVPEDQVTKDQRQAGKVVILACGFGGGVGAYQAMAKNYGMKISDAEASKIVKGWRRNNRWAQAFWKKLEKAAMNAIRNPNTLHEAGRITFVYEPKLLRGTLMAFLPSGRPLMYPEASIQRTEKFGKEQETIIFRHPTYGLTDTYGGKMAENVTQAAAADCLRELLVRMQDVTVLHTHDEDVLEVPEDELMEQCARLHAEMLRVPSWAKGLPLGCEIEYGTRYKVIEGEYHPEKEAA